jgi:hypothetical protein
MAIEVLSKLGESITESEKNRKPSTMRNFNYQPTEDRAIPSSLRKGGKVKKTGYAKVHKGERMLTKAQAKKYRKRMRGK